MQIELDFRSPIFQQIFLVSNNDLIFNNILVKKSKKTKGKKKIHKLVNN